MNIRKPPQELALDLTVRSVMKYQMAAVIFDNYGIFSWGWNHVDGIGSVHAEIHAIKRANRKRIRKGATIVIAGYNNDSGKRVLSLPCSDCKNRIKASGIAEIIYQNPASHTGWSKI